MFGKKQFIFHDSKSATCVPPPLWQGPFNENPYTKLRLGRSKLTTQVYQQDILLEIGKMLPLNQLLQNELIDRQMGSVVSRKKRRGTDGGVRK